MLAIGQSEAPDMSLLCCYVTVVKDFSQTLSPPLFLWACHTPVELLL